MTNAKNKASESLYEEIAQALRDEGVDRAPEVDVEAGPRRRLTLLTAKEAAEYLHVSLFTLSKMEKEEELVPFRTPGGHRRYSVEMLNEYLERSRLASPRRQKTEEELRTLLLIDELTGLYNRRGFVALGHQQIKMANRTKKEMLLLFADFDDLKRINDTLGHPEGDRALIEVADVLKETFRESDIIARIGGDEFVVLAMETNGASPEILTTRLQENLGARNAEGNRRYKLSLSVGVARYDPESPCSIDELLARADRTMYEQKTGQPEALAQGGLQLR